MGRIRTLKPEFFRSRSLARVSIPARLTFQGLWCEADDFGRGVADPRLVKGAVWPLDDEMTWGEVAKHLDELETTGHISLYEIDGEQFYVIVSWEEHQAAAYRRGKPQFPAPCTTDNASTEPAEQSLHDESCKKVLELGTGNEELGGVANAPRSPNGSLPKARGSRIPDTFVVTDPMVAWALLKAPDVDWKIQTEKFVNYWKAKPGKDGVKLDWERTWRNWLLTAQEQTRRGPARAHL